MSKFDASTSTSLTAGPINGAQSKAPSSNVDAASLPHDEALAMGQMLQEGFRGLLFPKELEAQYQRETGVLRLRTVTFSAALIGVLYNLLLLSDWMLIPDMFHQALQWRLYTYTPVILLAWLALRRATSVRAVENLIFWAGVGAAAISAGLTIASESAQAGPYLVSLTVIVVFHNTIIRLQFRRALVLDCVVVSIFFCGWYLLPSASTAVMLSASLVMIAAAVFTLYGGYCQEHDVRENWLRLTRERLLQQELRHTTVSIEAASRVDALTQLLSRRHFDDTLLTMWEQARDTGSELNIIHIDIDHFNAYNQRMGHLMGDACLKTIAGMIPGHMHPHPTLLARFGGQEFIVAMMATPMSDAVTAAEALRKQVASLGDVTISIGVSSMRPNAPHASLTNLLAAADEALKFAKKKGRNQVMAFGTQD